VGGPRQKLTLFVCLLTTACMVVAAATPALGADASGENAPAGKKPTVDQKPLKVDAAALIERGFLEVEVHNDLDRAQIVHLRIVGLASSTEFRVAHLFARERAFKNEVDPDGSPTLRLKVEESAKLPKAGSYEAVLLASGASGGFARLPLAIVSAEASAVAKAKAEASSTGLNAAHAVDVTLVAVNFLPSPLSNLPGLLLVVTALLALALFVFWPRLRAAHKRLAQGLAVGLVIVGAVAIHHIVDDPWSASGPEHVVTRPIAVSPDVTGDTTVGTVASEDGSIASLEVNSKHQLRPVGLRAAASYSGTYDLTPGVDKGDAKASVVVRDFWPYAALVIALGVLIAYLLRRWFQVERPRAKARARLSGVRERYTTALGADKDGAGGCKLSLDKRVGERAKAIEENLKEEKFEDAEKKIDLLRAYVDDFFILRDELDRLAAIAHKLEAEQLKRDYGVPLASIDAHADAEAVLNKEDFDSSELDQEHTLLDARRKEVATQITFATAVCLHVSDIRAYLENLEPLLPKAPDGPAKEKLADLIKRLDELGGKYFRANGLDEVNALAPDYEDVTEGLPRLRPRRRRNVINSSSTAYAVDRVVEIDLDDEDEAAIPARRASIGWSVPGAPGATSLHRDDRVSLEISIFPPLPLAVDTVVVDFGDGNKEAWRVVAKNGATTLSVGHRYRTSGPVKVAIESPEGEELGSADLQFAQEPRREAEAKGFAQSERIVTTAAFALAVASGLAALYFKAPAWGQPTDYLAAFVWGGVTGEGVKLAASIADRTWGS
jgi:hypothetical protein